MSPGATIKIISNVVLGHTYKHLPGAVAPSSRKGSQHYRSKLTENQVLEARRLSRQGIPATEILRRMGLDITRTGLARAIEGYTWSGVRGPRVKHTVAEPPPNTDPLTPQQISLAIALRKIGTPWSRVKYLIGAEGKNVENLMKMVNNRIKEKSA